MKVCMSDRALTKREEEDGRAVGEKDAILRRLAVSRYARLDRQPSLLVYRMVSQ